MPKSGPLGFSKKTDINPTGPDSMPNHCAKNIKNDENPSQRFTNRRIVTVIVWR
jgi:hypothetical protein